MIDTSLDAWSKVKPKLGKLHSKVYDAILEHPGHTTAELGKMLNVPTQSMAGRPGELLAKGLVKRDYKKICEVTDNYAYVWSKK